MEPADMLAQYFEQSARVEIDAAYFFGSMSSGRQHSESDVDVAILFSRTNPADALTRGLAAEAICADLVAILHRNRIDVVPLNDAPPLFARAILQQGQRIFTRNAATVHAFERNTLLRAADVEPFVQRGRRRLLEQLRASLPSDSSGA
jgi:predicted nucleotidyltransferase